jgi:hypothetical protein
MADDVLSKWRKDAVPVPPALVKNSEPDAGEESGGDERPTRFRQHCLELRPRNSLCSFPAYSQLIDTLVDSVENPTFIALVFLHVLVIVRGRNLGVHVAGLHQRTLWLIEEHTTPPANPKALYVESMEFISENIHAAVAALRASNGKTHESEPKRRNVG